MKNKISLLVVTILISLAMASSLSVAIESRKYDKYDIKFSKNTSIEKVVINKANMPLERYLSDTSKIVTEKDEDSEEEKEVITTEEENSGFSIMLSTIDDLYIKFDGNVEVFLNGTKVDTGDGHYNRVIGRIELLKNNMKYVILLFFILLPIVFGINIYIKKFLIKLKNDDAKLIHIILFMLSIFLFYLFAFYFCMYISSLVTVTFMVIVISGMLFYLKDEINKNLEKAYLILATTFGITMLFIIPPFNVPDEGAHFTKSFEYTLNQTTEDARCNLPESIENFRYKYEYGSQDYGARLNFKTYFSDLFDSGDYQKLSNNTRGYRNTINLPLLAYIPSILIFAVLRIMNASPFVLFFSGRLANLMIMIIICYYSLKNLPRFKNIFFVVALFPMFLHQGIGINQDWLTNAMSVAIIAYIIKIRYLYDKVDIKNILILSLMAVSMAFCKFGYFIVALLAVTIPNDKFKNKKLGVIFKILIVLVPAIIAYSQNSGAINKAADAESKTNYYTLSYAIENPFKIIKIFWNTFVQRGKLDLFSGLCDGFGVSTKWLDSISNFIVSSLCLILILTAKNEDEKKLKVIDRIVLLVVMGMICGVIYCSLLFTWTNVGNDTVSGLQARYFIIPALLLYMSFDNDILRINKKYKSMVQVISVLIMYFEIFTALAVSFY